MKYLVVILAIFLSTTILLSNSVSKSITNMENIHENSIAGEYTLGSSSPSGRAHLLIFTDRTFAIAYFGGIQTGKWEHEGNNMYKFTPHSKETDFELFGRNNKQLCGSVKIAFIGFEDGNTFVQLRNSADEEYNMQQVFNDNANCFAHPYVHTFNKSAKSISFLSFGYLRKSNPIVTFNNSNGYNDFIAKYKQSDEPLKSFSATFENQTLNFEDGDSASQLPLDGDSKDIKAIKQFMDSQTNQKAIYCNPFYNMLGGLSDSLQIKDMKKTFTFNAEKNAYIDSAHYVEGQEIVESDQSYHNLSIIYSFEILKDYTIHSIKYNVDKKNLFHAQCKELPIRKTKDSYF